MRVNVSQLPTVGSGPYLWMIDRFQVIALDGFPTSIAWIITEHCCSHPGVENAR